MAERREAMGIHWMRRGEDSEAIPPAYTEFIGAQLLRAVAADRGWEGPLTLAKGSEA